MFLIISDATLKSFSFEYTYFNTFICSSVLSLTIPFNEYISSYLSKISEISFKLPIISSFWSKLLIILLASLLTKTSFKKLNLSSIPLILELSFEIITCNSFSFSLNKFMFSTSLALFFFKFNQYFKLNFDPLVNFSKRYPFSFSFISFTPSLIDLFPKAISLEISLYLLFLNNSLSITS